MMLEDRSGSGDPALLTANLKKFMAASGKRPEIALIVPTYLPDVPQLYVDVDRAKVQQQQVSLADVYTTLQTFMGGYLVNYFNRFGRLAARSPSAPSQPCGGRPELSSPHASMNTRPRN
jgi:HAE1 family hydrophobic/amphiphilic exporter-1